MKFRTWFASIISGQDMFGHPVVLNFNQKGETHNTFVGGLLGIFIKVVLILYVYGKAVRLVEKSDNSIGYEITSGELHALPEYPFKGTRFLPILQVFDMVSLSPKAVRP